MPLLEKAKDNDLFPQISNDKLAPIINELKALGELRNKKGGHGKTKDDTKAKAGHARLAMHHALANMMFIAETYLNTGK